MIYTVEVTRDGDTWIADVVNSPGAHTYARDLASLDANVREVIALVTGIDEVSGISARYTYVDTDQ